MKHLSFSYQGARALGDNRPAITVMRELGIKYQSFLPHKIDDSCWFWNCGNIPEALPEYITELNIITPLDFVHNLLD